MRHGLRARRQPSGTGCFLAATRRWCRWRLASSGDTIAAIVDELLLRQVVRRDGRGRSMTLKDILVVAPCNLQVRCLRAKLPPGARIGSVDKFQGQEAPVVMVSLCASILDKAPRGAEFLLSPNRLNVAVSGAEALANVADYRR